MMFFDSERPRKFLDENGFACTFRTFNYPRKSTQKLKHHEISADGSINKSIEVVYGKAVVCNLKDVYSCEDIELFVEFSGFDDVDEWVTEISKLDGFRLPFRGGFKKLGNLCFVVKL